MEMDDKAAELLDKAKKRFKAAQEAEQKQRLREREDLRFQVPELQWDDNARAAREGKAGDGIPTPARPVLSIPKLDQPIQLVINQERAAKLGVSIQPLSADADPKTAEVLEGIYRRIERDSHAHVARSWAFDRAAKAGRGAYRVNTQYDDQSDNPFDQRIVIERILDQSAVYFDPSATMPDFRDGEFAFVTSWVPLATFKREWPKAKISGEDMTFADAVREQPEWVKGEGETAAVMVCEYWHKEHSAVTLSLLEDGTVAEGEKAQKGAIATRTKDKVTVYVCKITGWETLEEPQEWNGRFIPLIPTIGRELQMFDGERRWTGIIGPAKDAQRLYNYAVSSAVEVAALEPKAPWIMAEGQDEGYEDMWATSNTRNYPALKYKPTTLAGQPVAAPQRAQVDVGRLGPSMALIQQADSFIQTATATFDPALGRLSSREKSGRAIMALQEQSDAGNSHYLHNLADISMSYEAEVVLDLIPAIYDRPGRVARTLDTEDESNTVLLNQPFMPDPQTKMPVPAQPGQQGAKLYDLRKGTYSVAVSIGKARQTALQEGAEEIGQILQAQPQLMPIIGPLYFRYRDFPGAKEIADILGKMRDKQFPGLGEKEGEAPTPEQAQAKLSAAEQQMKQMAEQIQQMGQALETQQAKSAATVQKAQIDAEAKVAVAQIDQQTQIMLRELTAKVDMMLEASKQEHESKEAQSERVYDAVKTAATAPVPEWTGDNDTPLEVRGEI
jgi:hypothetical protein